MEPSIQENGDEAGEGRETKETDPGSPRRCDIIIISGRKEKCEAAKEALEVRLPHSFSSLVVQTLPGWQQTVDPTISVPKVQAFSSLLTQPREVISFHQDSGFYSLLPVSSVRA